MYRDLLLIDPFIYYVYYIIYYKYNIILLYITIV